MIFSPEMEASILALLFFFKVWLFLIILGRIAGYAGIVMYTLFPPRVEMTRPSWPPPPDGGASGGPA